MQFLRFRISFENRLAGNWPRLWSHQPHLALCGCIFGILSSMCIAKEPFFLRSPEVTTFSILIAFILQFIISLYWGFCVFVLSFPDNVIDYRVLPKLTTILIIIAMIMLGPLLLTEYLAVGSAVQQLDLFALEMTIMLVLVVYTRAAGGMQKLGHPILQAVLLTMLLSVALFLLSWVGAGALVNTISMSFVVVFALVRLVICLCTGRRTDRAAGLILVGIVLLFVGIMSGVISTAPDLAGMIGLHLTAAGSGLSRLFPRNLGADSRVILFAVIVAAIWTDLSNWALVRFWLLPKVEP